MNLTSLIMDLILMALLVAALIFGMRLHRNLKVLRAGQEAFAQAVHELDSAAIRAHNSLKELRGNADESQELLHGRILAARDLMQKLDAQVSRAERVHKDLDAGIASAAMVQMSRPQSVAQPAPQSSPMAAAPQHPSPATPRVVRRPFDRDVVRDVPPAPMPRARTSVLPALPAEDESEIIDKVHMSELVVANLNEMIRSLNMPTRRPLSVEDDLFGAEDR